MIEPPDLERTRALHQRSSLGVALVSFDGTILWANTTTCHLWGRAEDDLVGSSVLDLVHGDDRRAALEELAEFERGSVDETQHERRFLRADGSVVSIESLTHVCRGIDGTPRHLHSVLVDLDSGGAAHGTPSWMHEVVQSSQDAIIATTLEGIILNWNSGAERIFGYSAAEMVGQSASLLRPPSSETEIGRLTTRISRGERIEHRVVRLRKDGTAVTLISNSTPIRDAEGAVIGTATIAHDLDEQERADAVFRSLLEAAPDAMVCVNDQGVISLVNTQAEQLFGYPRQELIGKGVELLVPDRSKAEHPAHRAQYFADPEPRQMGAAGELVARRRDGTEFVAEIALSAIDTQDGTLVSATIRDGTERQQAAIVASSADAMIGRAMDGTITSWNAAAERMYGFSAAEALGTDMAIVVPASRAGELTELTARVRRGEPVENHETQRVRKDGVTIDVAVTLSPILDTHAEIVGTSSVARDITMARRALAASRVLEARTSAILESAMDSIISMDHHGRIVEFNPAAERTFGYTRTDAIGQTMAELIIPPALRHRHQRGLAHFLATGEAPIFGERLDLTALHADGTEFPVELTVTKVDLPGEPLFTGYLRDLSEKRRAESDLAESARLLEAMLDNSPALICLTDVDGRFLHMNRPLEAALGIEPGRAKGMTSSDIWAPGAARRYREKDLLVLTTGKPIEYESVAPHPDGDRTYLTSKFPVFDIAGETYAIASIATDITEGKAAETERELLGERLRQSERLETLGQLAGGVAHDFNNLLGVILNYAEFVREGTADRPEVSADVQQIRRAAERGAELTRQLLIVGRREAIRHEVLQVKSIVDDVRELLVRSIGAHIELITTTDGPLPTVRADRGQMEQVLLNLAINARDAMPDGGTLTIATRVADLDDDYARLHPDATSGRHIEVRVSDTGVGMTADVAGHMFEPFFTTKPRGHGTGLGLATVYGIVTGAGGSVSVYSEPGLGTTFRLLLPAADQPMAPEARDAAQHLDGHGETILVVEDEEALLRSTSRILRTHGYVVVEATNGGDALDLATSGKHNLDLVVTDAVMPHLSGRDLADRLAATHPALPIVFMSGYTEGMVGTNRITTEGIALVEKPFTTVTLLRAIRTALDQGPADP
jgi:PAS domain S-box-containing protein